jgi:hypothetical protein
VSLSESSSPLPPVLHLPPPSSPVICPTSLFPSTWPLLSSSPSRLLPCVPLTPSHLHLYDHPFYSVSTCTPALHTPSSSFLFRPRGIPQLMSQLPFPLHHLHSVDAIAPIIPFFTSAIGVPRSSPAKQHPKRDRSADPGGTIRRPPRPRRQS